MLWCNTNFAWDFVNSYFIQTLYEDYKKEEKTKRSIIDLFTRNYLWLK